MKLDAILIKPKITEKALSKNKNGVYSFQVHENATKHQVKTAVENLFGLKVKEVKTTVRKGKVKSNRRTRTLTRMPNKKTAHVKVLNGTIDLFPKS